MSDFTHFNEQGRAKMVDVSNKETSTRIAVAHSSIQVNEKIYNQIQNGKNKKGDVLGTAQIAGIMAAKNTSQLIPMCHPLQLTGIDIEFNWDVEDLNNLNITATVKTKGQTGVEMEALTAASVSALTIYDMCKAVDKGMIIGETYLSHKSGGVNGDFNRQ
ncbi:MULTISPECIES: cyclic pyranopterin monophosphate synthase MoaC [Mammaliicoccus]|jgi:cyclic pyranopterin phosphate synthase|uniref:Cyclic pyranopterin monophosphate synthase n=1 Tax=Mammaliicoccus lentus TaxID=42858 RepID=A0ABS6GVL0_MAMLE|nr:MULTISPECIES: cyclic pyranopterin monophosphate synthase MoaC [Mammaliicoccus]HBV04784.1 cyclic pyranopterin monophosphate synthase MoaC [Staphylococcus sp.]MBF0748244.1 cyclic pyranopterin monophosphate synthase MoaC [Mammaliicoccus lentus]MBF0794113.1 cyclic pyranopterin monophosphate synthase MoaC [Mammaliicoccus lentus]MBF0842797.1 cyclic pyranopterin monophosphate synthase MoaC [Mammaliicoccus lentus]MBU6113154.1 cyclic pyranopterin monophosphate synthase MoaC [Mammaliicoccus lentus]